MKRARVEAIERGATSSEAGAGVPAKEPGLRLATSAAPRGASFPIFDSKKPGKRKLGNAAVAEIERDEDRRFGLRVEIPG